MSDLVLASEYTETALQLPDDLSFEKWEEIGFVLNQMGRSHQWWVGDWLNYGERAYGEKYAQAMDATGLDYSTVTGAAWVAKAVESCRRRQSLSWSHHAEVAKLEPPVQDEWLDRAEAHQWSRSELRAEMKGESGEDMQVRCPTCNSVVRADKLQGGRDEQQ